MGDHRALGREALRDLLAGRGITFRRTKTWKESTGPGCDAKRGRTEHVVERFPDRVSAFDEFGPLGIRLIAGLGWTPHGQLDRLPATYRRTYGISYFHGCYALGDDTLWAVNRRRKGSDHTWDALRSIRTARPDCAPIYVVPANLSAHKNWRIRSRASRNGIELCFTPTYTIWANPIGAYVGPLRQFAIANSNYPNHSVQTRALHARPHSRPRGVGGCGVREHAPATRRDEGIHTGTDIRRVASSSALMPSVVADVLYGLGIGRRVRATASCNRGPVARVVA